MESEIARTIDAQLSHNGTERPEQSDIKVEVPKPRPFQVRAVPKLKKSECVAVVLIFFFWLSLFAGGIIVDTRPSRCLISEAGVKALEGEVNYNKSPCNVQGDPNVLKMLKASGIVLFWFLPINIALICTSAGVLGTFGNRADLADDMSARPSQDNTNPYISAVLRGFFVYLIMISGLLLLDVNPFSDPSPGQYIRLAGFLSLFGFVLNYQPRLFREIVIWAFNRIEQREVSGTAEVTVHQEKHTHISQTIEANAEIGTSSSPQNTELVPK
jgi:hypothetical protein